jgi:hypothetical protein
MFAVHELFRYFVAILYLRWHFGWNINGISLVQWDVVDGKPTFSWWKYAGKYILLLGSSALAILNKIKKYFLMLPKKIWIFFYFQIFFASVTSHNNAKSQTEILILCFCVTYNIKYFARLWDTSWTICGFFWNSKLWFLIFFLTEITNAHVHQISTQNMQTNCLIKKRITFILD